MIKRLLILQARRRAVLLHILEELVVVLVFLPVFHFHLHVWRILLNELLDSLVIIFDRPSFAVALVVSNLVVLITQFLEVLL